MSDLLPEVRAILERLWHDVELIAGLLLKHGRITSEMIDEVLPSKPEGEAVPQIL